MRKFEKNMQVNPDYRKKKVGLEKKLNWFQRRSFKRMINRGNDDAIVHYLRITFSFYKSSACFEPYLITWQDCYVYSVAIQRNLIEKTRLAINSPFYDQRSWDLFLQKMQQKCTKKISFLRNFYHFLRSFFLKSLY